MHYEGMHLVVLVFLELGVAYEDNDIMKLDDSSFSKAKLLGEQIVIKK